MTQERKEEGSTARWIQEIRDIGEAFQASSEELGQWMEGDTVVTRIRMGSSGEIFERSVNSAKGPMGVRLTRVQAEPWFRE